MNFMTKTFLIIDNPFYYRVYDINDAFREAGIDAEFEICGNIFDALNVIRKWKDRGLKLDVITCDIHGTQGDSGIIALTKILDKVATQIGEDMLPQQVFFNSAEPRDRPIATPYGVSPCVICDSEIMSLSSEQGKYNSSSRAEGRALRDYLNANWGTRFIMSKAEEEISRDPDCRLSPDDAIELLKLGRLDPQGALLRIQLDEPKPFIPAPWVDIDGPRPSCRLYFSDAADNGAVAGSAVYGTDDIARVSDRSPGEPLILVLNDAIGFEAPPQGISGLVVLNNDTHAMHIRQVCSNMGMTALIGAERDGTRNNYDLADGVLSFHEYDGEDQSGPLTAGSGLTIETCSNGGTLYAGRLALRQDDIGTLWDFRDVIAEADAQLIARGLTIKAHADTPEQVRQAIDIGAHGIGLVRTEHMFFQPDKRAMLRTYLLSRSPDAALVASFREAQTADLAAVLEAAKKAEKDFPVTIRLLDAPPHEFMGAQDVEAFKARVGRHNMRGAQAGLRTKGLYESQIQALCAASDMVRFRHPVNVLVPNVVSEGEMERVRQIFDVHARGGMTLSPMVETRRYLQELALQPPLYGSVSYGTNDLTSDFMDGVARNDTPGIIDWMKRNAFREGNPFLSLASRVKDDIMTLQGRDDAPKATICGQQVAKDERSIRWAARNGIGLSVPFKNVPYVKLVAGQEVLSIK